MEDENKTREELRKEIAALRWEISELKTLKSAEDDKSKHSKKEPHGLNFMHLPLPEQNLPQDKESAVKEDASTVKERANIGRTRAIGVREDTSIRKEEARRTGIDLVSDLPWGTHLCQFYLTKEDLIDILVPYFKEGLENNECCLWITSEPLDAEDAKLSLKEAVKDVDDYLEKGQIEILDYRQWYTKSGRFESDRVLQLWIEREQQALARGFDGLRLTGNTFWLDQSNWRDFVEYEAAIDRVIGKHRMIAICSYSLNKCRVSNIIDVVSNHQCALIRQNGKWVGIESAERKRVQKALRESEERYRSHLEDVVEERTRELTAANKRLLQEISERKRAEEALRKQAQIINQIHDSVVSTDLDGQVTSWNKGAERLYGYTEEEVLARHISFLYPEDEHDFLQYKVIAPLKENGYHEVEVRSRGKTGEDIYVHLSLSLMRDNAGKVIGMVSYSMDITGRKRAEMDKEKIQAQLLQSQKMEAIGILAGGVAHDFNNLLTAIQGYTSLAMMKVHGSEPLSRDLNQVSLAAGRAANLTRQLLLFSRRQPIEPASFSLNRTIDDLFKMLHRLIGEDITINTKLEPDLWSIRADEGTIEQVIVNLAVNARDAMPKGGTLTIKTENIILDEEQARLISDARPGQFVRLTIADTGTGIDKNIVNRIFEPFFTTKDAGKGTGLGLSVVYGIIRQHEGWIKIYSEPGYGSAFAIYLPALCVKPKAEVKETDSLIEFQGDGERILLVEDEESVRAFISRMLNENGYTVIQAADAEEALNIFKRENGGFHLVISDVVLPDYTGLELVERLLLARSDLQILLISGYPDQKSQWATIRRRGFRFIQKPFTLADMLRSVRELTSHSYRIFTDEALKVR